MNKRNVRPRSGLILLVILGEEGAYKPALAGLYVRASAMIRRDVRPRSGLISPLIRVEGGTYKPR